MESFSPASCSVGGGEELLITGSNISTQSRVVFMEKGPEGRSLWEMDARVVPEKSSGSSIVVEVPPYSKKTSDPVQVQFYLSNGKRRRSLTHNFTYLPGVKQERWETDLISHNPPGFCPTSCQVPPHRTNVVYYDSCDPPALCGPPPQDTPRLHHPPPSLPFPHTSSIPLRTSAGSVPPQTSTVPHQTLIPLQTSIMPPQMSMMPPQASSAGLQTFPVPPAASSGGPQRRPPPSLSSRGAFVTPADPQEDSGPGEGLCIKQEPEDPQPNLGSLGLQEITLDDVNEIIDRDIGSLSSGAQPDQFDQYHQYDWENKSSEAGSPFCGGPQ